MAVFW